MLESKRLSPQEALAIVPQICDALQYAHNAGVVHRDIKPENILLDKIGRVKIADFGLAKLMGRETEDLALTGAGQVMGTPHYMAPEQLEHPQDVDHRADIYSLGVVFYQMLTGELPLGRFAPPSKKVEIDVRLDEVVLRALEKEPERRYQQVSEVKTEVEAIARTKPGTAHSPLAARAADGSSMRPRLSRLGIAGAVWAPFFLAAKIYLLFVMRPLPGAESLPVPPFQQVLNAIGMLLVLAISALGVTAPFGTTILGLVSLSKIRRSAGRLYGLGLALFDSMLYPLLILDWLIGLLCAMFVVALRQAAGHHGGGPPDWRFVFLLAIPVSAVLDFFIVRAAWRTVNRPVGTSRRLAQLGRRNRMNDKPIAYVGLFLVLAGFLAVIGLIAFGESVGWLRDSREGVGWASFAMIIVGCLFGLINWRTAPGKVAACFGGVLAVSLFLWMATAIGPHPVARPPDFEPEFIEPAPPPASQPQDKSAPPKRATLPIGQVIERMIRMTTKGLGNQALDLSTGKEWRVPADLERRSTQAFRHWIAERHVDLLVGTDGKNQFLMIVGGKLAKIANERWERVGLDELRAALAATNPGLDIVQARGDEFWQSYRLPQAVEPPFTLAFQTRDNNVGILQITDIDDPLKPQPTPEVKSPKNSPQRNMDLEDDIPPEVEVDPTLVEHGIRLRYMLARTTGVAQFPPSPSPFDANHPGNSDTGGDAKPRASGKAGQTIESIDSGAVPELKPKEWWPGRSEALDEGFDKLRRSVVDFARQQGETPPDEDTQKSIWDQELERMEDVYPPLRTATVKELDDFTHGKFDDKANVTRIKEMIAVAKRDNRPLPDAELFIVNGTLAGRLKGSELEAAKRFLATYLQSLQGDEALGKGDTTVPRTSAPAMSALGTLTAAAAQAPKQADGGQKQIANSIGMKLTLVPSGEFQMGSGESTEETAAFFKKNYGMDFLTADLFKDEHPQHRVRITKPFYLGTYHVTRGEFRQFVKDSGYKTDAEKGDRPGAWGWDTEKKDVDRNAKYSWRNVGFKQTDEHPVVCVSWNDAMAFCKWLSGKEGKTYRLPTEAEWEYACRAGTTTLYYSGDDPETLAKVGNVADATFKAKFPDWKYTLKASDGYVFTAPVGTFKPNAFGLYDMHGNASQWCADWYSENYYGKSPADDPKGPDAGMHVLRGGSWYLGPNYTRSAQRGKSPLDYRDADIGFRVARSR